MMIEVVSLKLFDQDFQVNFHIQLLIAVRQEEIIFSKKIERFVVLSGIAEIKIRKIGSDITDSFILNGDNPSFIDMPVWHTHNIKNIGNEP